MHFPRVLAGFLAGSLATIMATAGFAETLERPVKLIPVEADRNALTRTFFGHVVARETVDLAFQVGGQVVQLPVIEGQPIAKGALVAQLDLEPFELARDQALLEKDQADRTLERLRRLEGNTVSQVSVDDAETSAKLADLAVRNAERSLNDATLTAPFDGLVAVRHVANFSTIAAGTAIVRLHDMSELRIEIDVPEVLFQQAGQNPDLDIFARFPASEELFPLEVREFNAQTSDVGQTFRITLGMPPPEGLIVLPGSSVEVISTLRFPGERIIIPFTSVVFGSDGTPHVVLFEPAGADEGEVRRVPIEIQPTTTGAIRVLSGVETGQEIVASGGARLADGDRVTRYRGLPN